MKATPLLLLLPLVFSCKKQVVTDPPGCGQQVANVAGVYSLSRVTGYQGTIGNDITSSIDACERTASVELRIDKVALYIESGTCNSSDTGTWDIINTRIHINAGPLHYTECELINNCDSISIIESGVGGGTIVNVYRKK